MGAPGDAEWSIVTSHLIVKLLTPALPREELITAAEQTVVQNEKVTCRIKPRVQFMSFHLK